MNIWSFHRLYEFIYRLSSSIWNIHCLYDLTTNYMKVLTDCEPSHWLFVELCQLQDHKPSHRLKIQSPVQVEVVLNPSHLNFEVRVTNWRTRARDPAIGSYLSILLETYDPRGLTRTWLLQQDPNSNCFNIEAHNSSCSRIVLFTSFPSFFLIKSSFKP